MACYYTHYKEEESGVPQCNTVMYLPHGSPPQTWISGFLWLQSWW